MSEKELTPDSARAKKSRSSRLDQGYMRFDCLVNPKAGKRAKSVMRRRKLNKTELVEKLIDEEYLRLKEGTGNGEDQQG